MVQRTTNFSHVAFAEYCAYANPAFTGKGGFSRFLAAVGERPSRDHTLDRIDNQRGYEEGNLRWALRTVQERNKERRTYYGRTVEDWARVLDLRPTTVRKRMARGWCDARMFPVQYRLTETR